MLNRYSRIPWVMNIIKSETHIHRVTTNLRLGKSRIIRVFYIQLRSIKIFHKQPQLDTCRKHSAKKTIAKSILPSYSLMSKQTYFIIKERHSNAMKLFHKIQRHICSYVSSLRIVLKSGEINGIGANNIHLITFSYRSRIIIRFHSPIMTKRHIILSFGGQIHQNKQ